MNNRDYQSMPWVSSHWLISILKSPAECWRKYIDPNRTMQEPTDSMKFGTLIHCLILTPKLFEQEFLIADFERRSLKGKTQYAELSAAGKILISPSQYARAQAIVSALKSNSDAFKLLRYGSKEKTIVQPRHRQLLPLKARLDVLNQTKHLVVELKTTYSIQAIETAIERYRYYLSASFYRDISKSQTVNFVFVQTAEPFQVKILEMTPEQLQIGKEQYQSALRLFDECWSSNHWPEAEPPSKLEDELCIPSHFLPKRYDLPVGELAL